MRPDQSGPPERKHAPDGDERQVSEVHNDGRIGEPDQHDSVDRRSLPLSRVDALQGKDVGMDEPRAEIVDVIIDCSDANRRAPELGRGETDENVGASGSQHFAGGEWVDPVGLNSRAH
jgi:hypothetical protein